MRTHTRIMITVGPASSDRRTLGRLLEAGADLFRLNLSHGSHDDHRRAISTVRDLAGGAGKDVGILVDLMGPRFRLGKLPPDGLELQAGTEVSLSQGCLERQSVEIPVDGPAFLHALTPGQRLLIDHGLIELRVLEARNTIVVAEVVTGGVVFTRKGINLPDLEMPIAVSEKDRRDIRFAVEQEADFVAGSYVGGPDDVEELRALAGGSGGSPSIVAKLERGLAIENLDAIIDSADGVLVARGDLGVEIPLERVPVLQKEIIQKCRIAGRPTIVATHLLESMIRCPRPTRAEVSDVANAVLDGADVLLLTGETAAGRYPVEAVEIMAKIVREAERFSVVSGQGARDSPI